ncbi:uncharacterized protein PHACADRAFT_201717 [Phanerochaete carnosa HHB-10118-sp]|uniref:Uncharacterized protein n=1 Tax=Phanerochaete carnosa (strain HHB-10118-sp) TaxID=650164 RepID=K5VRR8_PHACS|nr:uncharacterized protein PHACADRAFT_201717 [Phanerochaete carnosa HHB-10118-sp]EKM49455.1 hypothetical protein PHACADRAFT_201717 [Phanerochaete carnosa HHB-10118-sp]
MTPSSPQEYLMVRFYRAILAFFQSGVNENPFSPERFLVEEDSLIAREPIRREKMVEKAGISMPIKAPTLQTAQSPASVSKKVLAILRIILLLAAQLIISILVGVFITPRVSCTQLPPFLNRYCPPSSIENAYHGQAACPCLIPPTPHSCAAPLLQGGGISAGADGAVIAGNPNEFSLLGLTNLASSSSGARILQKFCKIGPRTSLMDRLLRSSDCHHADWVLADSLEQHECWEFYGSEALLPIRLDARSTISHFSVGHSSSGDPSRAPRVLVVWGVVDGTQREDLLQQLSNLHATFMARLPSGWRIPVLQEHFLIPLTYILHELIQFGGPDTGTY